MLAIRNQEGWKDLDRIQNARPGQYCHLHRKKVVVQTQIERKSFGLVCWQSSRAECCRRSSYQPASKEKDFVDFHALNMCAGETALLIRTAILMCVLQLWAFGTSARASTTRGAR